MIGRVIRHELKLIWSRLWVLLLVIAFLAGALVLLSHVPDLYKTIVAETRPEGITKAEILNQYRVLIKMLDQSEKSEISILRFFLDTGTDQFEYYDLANIATHYQGAENIATSYSIAEGAELLMVPLSIVLGLFLFAFPFKSGAIQMELSSGISKKSLVIGKALIGLLLLFFYSGIILSLSLLTARENLGQLFLFKYRDGYASATFASILTMKLIGMLIGGLFYFAVSSLLGTALPRSYLGPSILFIVCLLCFLFSNVDMPKWGYYGEPSGRALSTLFLVPFSNVFLASNFGFLGESVIVLGSYALLAVSAVFGIYVYIKRSNV